jgi:hypothetical protein
LKERRFAVLTKRTYILAVLIFCLVIPYPILTYSAISSNHVDRLWLLFVLLLLDLPFPFILDRVSAVIDIDENGLSYKSLFKKYGMRWDDIVETGIKPVKSSYGIRRYIYFSTTCMPSNIERKNPSNEFLMLEYSKPILDVIEHYWSKPIKR